MTDRECLIVGAVPRSGGDVFYECLLGAYRLVIAADAGGEWCVDRGRIPDAVVGDFDSSADGARQRLRALGVDVVEYPPAKDASDLELAVAEARRRGATQLTITAASSLRPDHTLATIGVLAAAADIGAEIAEPDFTAWALSGDGRSSIRLAGPAGAAVSVFAISGPARGVTLEGLRYPLHDAELAPLSSHGLSNELTGAVASIDVADGRLLVISPGHPAARAVLV
jgi:thiamine pyrophosphokinase